MSNLISGKEALIALANGEDVEFKAQRVGKWVNIKDIPEYKVTDLLENKLHDEFRIKPRTITLNGIEVPAPFEPKDGEQAFYITAFGGYDALVFDWQLNDFGYWRTEEEVKQVVKALRSIFK